MHKQKMFSEMERRDMNRLRAELADVLTPDLDTDFNIHRWIHGWHGDIPEAARRFRVYIENRKVAQLDDPNFLENIHSHPIMKKYAHFFSFSIVPLGVNPIDNTVLILQRFQGVDYHTMTRVMSCSQFLQLYFVTCEWNLRQVLKCEAESGRKSGLTMIFDLDHFPLLQYANPQSAIYKIFMMCLGLLQDYYCDLLHRLLIVNAPTMFSVVLAIAKRFLHPATQKKLVTASHKEDLFKFVSPVVLPVRYGGHRRLASETLALGGTTWRVDPESFTLVPRPIQEADLFVEKKYSKGIFHHKPIIEHVEARNVLAIRRYAANAGSKLVWDFTTSSEVQFTVVYLLPNGEKTRLAPLWGVITPKLPETGSVTCSQVGEYALEFYTGSSNVKIKYVVDVE